MYFDAILVIILARGVRCCEGVHLFLESWASVAIRFAFFSDALDAAAVEFCEVHVVEGLGYDFVSGTGRVVIFHKHVYGHIKRQTARAVYDDPVFYYFYLYGVRGTIISVANGVDYSFSDGIDGIVPVAVVFGFAGYEDALMYVGLDEIYGLVDLVLDVPCDIFVAVDKGAIFKCTGMDYCLWEFDLGIFGEEKVGGSGDLGFGSYPFQFLQDEPGVVV